MILGLNKKLNTCVIVNRNYPPDHGATGTSANELARFLVTRGIDIKVVCVDGVYEGGGIENNSICGDIYRIKSFYSGKNKIIRLLSSLIEGLFLARKAVSLSPSCIICMTDPPLLNLWVSYYSRKTCRPWIYWSMDLYPDAFYAANLVSEKNVFYQLLQNYLQRNLPAGLIALGRNQADFISESFGEISQKVILPCGVRDLNKSNVVPSWKQNNDKIIIGYIGNMGEAHDEKFLTAVIDSFIPSKYILILSLYGAKADFVIEHAQGKQGIVFLQNISLNDLKFIDIHIVTLSPHWDHICVPSKAFSAVSVGCSLILNGSKESDIYSELIEASWHFGFGEYNRLKYFFSKIDRIDIEKKQIKALRLSHSFREQKYVSFERIFQMIRKY